MGHKDPEAKRAYARKWFRENYQRRKKELSKKNKEWRAKNPDKVKAQKLRYSKAHAEEIRKKSREYYHKRGGREKFLEKYHSDPEFKERQKHNSLRRLQRRRELIHSLRVSMGGKCSKCGYDEEVRILQFHHHNGGKKDNVTALQTLKAIEEEAAKCILLCPNCHALEHLNHD